MNGDGSPDVIVQCDGAPVPIAWRGLGRQRVVLNQLVDGESLTLRVDRPPRRVVENLDDRAQDLLRIAAYVYGADQMMSRGGEADVFGERWQRRFSLAVPVLDPDFWSDATTTKRLTELLNFLSDDVWEFSFAASKRGSRALMWVDPWAYEGAPDTVVLFSGGADSLCATLEEMLMHSRRPFLVSHYSNSVIKKRQQTLVDAMRHEAGSWYLPHIQLLVNRADGDAPETSQRSRAFLFAALGAVVGQAVGVADVLLSDNGIVSINLPFTRGQHGAMATRSTHPRVQHEFNVLARRVLGDTAPRVRNSLWTRTRPEVLAILRDTNCERLLRLTASCAHPRGRLAEEPHCGVCSQCIDRRFGVLAARLEEHDPATGYEIDIFRDNIPEKRARALTLGYYSLALRLHETDTVRALDQFQRLWECIPYTEGTPEQAADILTRLLRRHGSAVVRVMEQQFGAVRDLMARRRLPPYSLPALIRGVGSVAAEPTPEAAEFRRRGDVYVISFEGKTVHLAAMDGLSYLHTLLRSPGKDILAQDLYRSAGSRTTEAHGMLQSLLGAGEATSAGMHVAPEVASGTEADKQAIAEYKAQARALDEEERLAVERDDTDALVRIDAERAWLHRAIKQGRSLGGRRRADADPMVRSRQAVLAAIKRALREIAQQHPPLAHFLKSHIQTGTSCRYKPDDTVGWMT